MRNAIELLHLNIYYLIKNKLMYGYFEFWSWFKSIIDNFKLNIKIFNPCSGIN